MVKTYYTEYSEFNEEMYQMLLLAMNEGHECNTLIVPADVDKLGTLTYQFIRRMRKDGIYASPRLFINQGGLSWSVYFNVIGLQNHETK